MNVYQLYQIIYTKYEIRNIKTFRADRPIPIVALECLKPSCSTHTHLHFSRYIMYNIVRNHRIIICSSFTRNGYFNLCYDPLRNPSKFVNYVYVSFDGGINLIYLFLYFVEICVRKEKKKKGKENIAIEHAQCTFNLIHVFHVSVYILENVFQYNHNPE